MTSSNLFDTCPEAIAFRANEAIFKEGEPGTHMYAVIEGKIDLYVGSNLMETVEAGGIFGEMALIDARPRSATARARSNSRLIPIDEDRFKFMIAQTPNFGLQVMRELARRLRVMNRLLPE
jgi:CRP-like cAMP-binding protein